MKPSTLTCNEVTFVANLSTFTSVLSVTTSRVTSIPRRRRLHCKARFVLQPGRHLTVKPFVNVKQLPQRTCWILDTCHKGGHVMLMGSRNGPIPGTAAGGFRSYRYAGASGSDGSSDLLLVLPPIL